MEVFICSVLLYGTQTLSLPHFFFWDQKHSGLLEAEETPGKMSFHTFCVLLLMIFLNCSCWPLFEIRYWAWRALIGLVQLFFCLRIWGQGVGWGVFQNEQNTTKNSVQMNYLSLESCYFADSPRRVLGKEELTALEHTNESGKCNLS